MSEFITVAVRQGELRGRRCQTSNESTYFSFEGVPYAKPPLGSLRFKAPQPAEPWTGVRDATKPGSECLHYDGMIKKTIIGSEDCLFVNVYTPGLPPAKNGTSLRPVLFYIHGGGYAMGCGDIYHPEPFMEEDVVVVNFNYRLGYLGFLSLETLDVPGNAGLKDQTMALRWVKENIEAFGGDPDNITIFGESAGGASVHYHLLSPLSKGLFRRAIAQSGCAFSPWAQAHHPAARAKRLALAAGCDATTVSNPAALTKWLQEAPALKLLTSTSDEMTPQDYRNGIYTAFAPSVEPEHPGAFLPKTPKELLESGSEPSVPIIFGLTSHEGIMLLPECILQLNKFLTPNDPEKMPIYTPEQLEAESAKMLKEFASDLTILLPLEIPGRNDPTRSSELVQRLKDFFFNGKELSEETLDGLVDVFSDTQFNLGVIHSAREHARHGSPVYVYEFAFRGRINFLSTLLQPKVRGVSHADELGYLFSFTGFPQPQEGSPEALLRRRLLRLWTDFAREGVPTPSQDELIPTKWPPFSDKLDFLRIDDDLKADTGLFRERMLFWKELYGQTHSSKI